MFRRLVGPLVLGVVGVGILLLLGSWQVQRLSWKQAVLSEIERQIAASPVPVPETVSPIDHRFLAVTVSGRITGAEIHVLASNKDTGAGYRIISVLEFGERRFLLDRGFIPIADKSVIRSKRDIIVVGNLHWPDEIDSYTPEPDLAANIWFGRDVGAMAAALGTEPVLIVAGQDTGDGVTVFPVNTASIPNNHLNYAITWFLLALVWFGMTAYLVLRIKRQSND